jgi:methionyl aminopeptidase
MVKDNKKIAKMHEGGIILGSILSSLLDMVKPGVTTLALDHAAEALCKEKKVKSAFKGYQRYPATICAGPNDVVVHGIPDDTVLQEGDIVSIDMGIVYSRVYLDMARTVGVGTITKEARAFLDTSELALKRACTAARIGNRVGDIGYAIQMTVERAGYSVVREMVGHGIGHKLHEDPMIPGYGDPGTGKELYDGQTIAIETIINQGSPDIIISTSDGWTSRTKDGKLSALFEDTVLVSKESEVLTLL